VKTPPSASTSTSTTSAPRLRQRVRYRTHTRSLLYNKSDSLWLCIDTSLVGIGPKTGLLTAPRLKACHPPPIALPGPSHYQLLSATTSVRPGSSFQHQHISRILRQAPRRSLNRTRSHLEAVSRLRLGSVELSRADQHSQTSLPASTSVSEALVSSSYLDKSCIDQPTTSQPSRLIVQVRSTRRRRRTRETMEISLGSSVLTVRLTARVYKTRIV
jgi:hypothetical protein